MTRQRITSIARHTALTIALASGVTVASVAAGALLIAPAVSTVTDPSGSFRVPTFQLPSVQMPSLPSVSMPTLPSLARLTSPRVLALLLRFAVPVLLTTLALFALVRLPSAQRLLQRLRRRRPAISSPIAALGASTRMRTPIRPDRTPRAVAALAASGTAASEISWRTGLPLDAVALLLSLSSAQRQLQPPAA